ncbi:MAG TPA: PD-(D/E)XK nuclease family protein, partial [Pseudomonadales bacterium]|nr:PD-(D/E)XK nuclease family protein [Pseudomonadales bacterium]
LPAHLFELKRVVQATRTLWSPQRDTGDLRPPLPPPDTHSHWRVHSYTGVARRIVDAEDAAAPQTFTPGFGDDELESEPASTTRFNRFTFPKGPRAGVALHTLLENLDFSRTMADQSEHISRCLARIGLTRNVEQWHKVLSDWMSDVTATSLATDVRLGDVIRSRRLDEMEFHFPLSTDAGMLNLLKSQGYLGAGATLDIKVLQGMMTGLIDLVFESRGRYFLVDYKSNFLGANFEDYRTVHLENAIRHHHYDLQYLIYCVALRRYLMSRLPDFDYATQFGGVYYLFLRGMNGTADGSGVYFDKPDEAFLDRLDDILGGAA